MNIILSLGFLLIINVLVLVYIFAIYLVFVVVKTIRYNYTTNQKTALGGLWKHAFAPKKMIKIFLLFFFSINLFLYVNERVEWTGEDNAHYEAKEYFAVGNALFFYRKILFSIIPPDTKILLPLETLQGVIYSQGIKYLPKDDAESAIWDYNWFKYPYVRRGHRIGNKKNPEDEKAQQVFTQELWNDIEALNTKPLQDTQMRLQHFYRNFPAMADYFSLYQGFLTGTNNGSGKKLRTNSEYIQQNRLLVQWLQEMEKNWETSPYIQDFLEKNQITRVIIVSALKGTLEEVILSEIYDRTFTCKSESVSLYAQSRERLVGGDTHPGLIRKLKASLAKDIYDGDIINLRAQFIKLILNEYCGTEVAGKDDQQLDSPYSTPYFKKNWKNWLKAPYKEESKILEEIFNGNK